MVLKFSYSTLFACVGGFFLCRENAPGDDGTDDGSDASSISLFDDVGI